MRFIHLLFLLLSGTLLFNTCDVSERDDFNEEEWREDVESWHQGRIDNLLGPEPWLRLAGFYWLEEGHNSFGSSEENDIVFPFDNAPEQMGTFVVRDDRVLIETDQDSGIEHDGQTVRELTIFGPEIDERVTLEWNSLAWYIIERSDRLAVRLLDHNHPNLAEFDGIDRYPVSVEWRVEAEFKPFDPPQSLIVPNYIGDPSEEDILGVLEFEIDGQTVTLFPLADSLEDRFFVIFADRTNSSETYGGGRFVYTDPPDENNIVYIDFNRSYNPPCVFSPFATCPLPPPENRLPVEITAGELMYDKGVRY